MDAVLLSWKMQQIYVGLKYQKFRNYFIKIFSQSLQAQTRFQSGPQHSNNLALKAFKLILHPLNHYFHPGLISIGGPMNRDKLSIVQACRLKPVSGQ